MAKKVAGVKPLGVRERSKAERRTKVLSAARMLFTEFGYEAATMNQIAALAGLGKGTVFNYVTDKRDIIFLIFHEDMTKLVEAALAGALTRHGYVDKMMGIAELHYRLYAKNPKLSRILLNETLIHSQGLHLEEFLKLRSRLIKGMAIIVANEQKAGQISTAESADFIAKQTFLCFSSSVREWLMLPHPEWRSGLRQFKRSLHLLVHGTASSSARNVARSKSDSSCGEEGSDGDRLE